MMLRVLASGSFMMQRVPPSHPGRLPSPASSWQPGARLRTWRPTTGWSLAAASQRRISSSVVSCGRVAATRSRTRDSVSLTEPSVCRLQALFLKKAGREWPCERLQEQRATLKRPKSFQSSGKVSLLAEERRESSLPCVPGGLVARIRRFHRRGPGSIPGQGIVLHWPPSRRNLPSLGCQPACSKGQRQNSLHSEGQSRAKEGKSWWTTSQDTPLLFISVSLIRGSGFRERLSVSLRCTQPCRHASPRGAAPKKFTLFPSPLRRRLSG
ncbi:uncharacterized protein LOC129059670 [Pongo abelii]|uniref:uncharacterized protein LOC129059670 n=1 Tax=Pongo abelii TaxID=9601 RepID=UPI0023E86504|nr:uncharacterized protein LOC129059670 [Pongo abelii]